MSVDRGPRRRKSLRAGGSRRRNFTMIIASREALPRDPGSKAEVAELAKKYRRCSNTVTSSARQQRQRDFMSPSLPAGITGAAAHRSLSIPPSYRYTTPRARTPQTSLQVTRGASKRCPPPCCSRRGARSRPCCPVCCNADAAFWHNTAGEGIGGSPQREATRGQQSATMNIFSVSAVRDDTQVHWLGCIAINVRSEYSSALLRKHNPRRR